MTGEFSPVHETGHWLSVWLFGELNLWLDLVLHIVLVGGPVAFVVVLVAWLFVMIRRRRSRRRQRQASAHRLPEVPGLASSVFVQIFRHTRRSQIFLVIGSLVAMPVLYATLELPKLIINNAINSGHFPITVHGWTFGQVNYLFTLCALFLLAILLSGALKYAINVYKGRVAERMLRRLRLTVYRRWRSNAGRGDRAQVVPLLVQEVEPVGGFAADILVQPLFQGGTFLTILIFMFVQDPVLGAAAVTLLPVQLGLIPPLQRRINRLARSRVGEVRQFGGLIGAEMQDTNAANRLLREIGASLRRIERIRFDLYKIKYFMKGLNNFIAALTPFFFYTIGGYLVIMGELSFGALVAVLAAYKDFSAPLKELFLYYQTLEDVRVRYHEILRYLSAAPAMTDIERAKDVGTPQVAEDASPAGVMHAAAASVS